MGEFIRLPIQTDVAEEGGRQRWSATLVEATYQFDFRYNGWGDFWVLTIKDNRGNRVFGPRKIVYGQAYTVDDTFLMAFFDPQDEASSLTKTTLGDPVIGAVGLLE